MGERFTFVVVGRDEEATLPVALGRALDAARPGDRVWFVDSGSTDGSAALADGLGVEVVPAPVGKGRAMQVAFDRARSAGGAEGYLCFLDADYAWSERNIPAEVRDAAERTGADMVVGTYTEERRRVVMPGVYHPIVGALAPEALEHIDIALSGFRAVRPSVLRTPLPPGYGAETHLNLEATFGGAVVCSTPVGGFRGSLRGYTNISAILDDVAAAILDQAERYGRLDPVDRPRWERWIDEVRLVVADQPALGADDRAFLERLADVAARPLPAAPVGDAR